MNEAAIPQAGANPFSPRTVLLLATPQDEAAAA